MFFFFIIQHSVSFNLFKSAFTFLTNVIKSLASVKVLHYTFTQRLKTYLAAAGKYKQQPFFVFFLLMAFCRSSASVVQSDGVIISNSGQWKASAQSFQYEGYNTAHTFHSVIVTLLPRTLFPTRPERATETRRERADTRMCK